MIRKYLLLLAVFLGFTGFVSAQVQVRYEPRHRNVLENEYLRLLDVHMDPGDTSLFHIHATPSFFVVLTDTRVGEQINDSEWSVGQNSKGTFWYRSFFNDTLVHRVTNCDTVKFHVRDAELLKAFEPEQKLDPLPYTILLENEKLIAYSITDSSIGVCDIEGRGPILAQLVEGDPVVIADGIAQKTEMLKEGDYIYLEPHGRYRLQASVNSPIQLVLLEIK